MTAYFVTATGTDVGKTFVSASLLRHWRLQGRAVAALKPVMSGFDEADVAGSDAGRLLAALAAPMDRQGLDLISPWRFRAPLSPDMAAAREGRTIPFGKLVATTQAVASMMPAEGRLVVEGVGGVFVPLDDRHTVMDWMVASAIPVLLVAGSYLGTISHTLSSLAALQQRGLSTRAVIISQSASSPVPLGETAAVLARHAPGTPFLTLSRDPRADEIAALAGALDAMDRPA